MSDSDTDSADAGGTRSPEEIQEHIEATRQDLAETVDALTAKADVKARAKEQAQATKERAAAQVQVTRERAAEQVGAARVKVSGAAAQGKDALTDDEGTLRPEVPVVAAVAVAVIVGVVVVTAWRRRR